MFASIRTVSPEWDRKEIIIRAISFAHSEYGQSLLGDRLNIGPDFQRRFQLRPTTSSSHPLFLILAIHARIVCKVTAAAKQDSLWQKRVQLLERFCHHVKVS